ncbi:hypothetical protein [Pseudobdellovibrio sp. HCB154]|uniref:hypothetical protein n=1 Tax=Pseudobdellovibrio sp. HCB154 TaxID=3386277 RepID=UPI003916EA3A
MKIFAVVLSFALWSSHFAQAESLHLAGVVPLTGEVQIMHDKSGKLVVNKKGLNNLKLKNVRARQIASVDTPISWVVLEAP